MKSMKTILALGVCCAVTALAFAAGNTYTTKTGTAGSAANPTYVIFPGEAQKTPRLVNVNYDTDTNNAALTFRQGTTAYVLTQTNAATGTNIVINTTNGLSADAVVVLQKANGTCAWTNVYTTAGGSSTNLYLYPGGFGVAGAIGDQLFLMSSASSIPATSDAAVNGEAIYVGAYSRPMMIRLTPALLTNYIHSATVVYE